MNEFHIFGHLCPTYNKAPDSVHKIDALLNCVAFQ